MESTREKAGDMALQCDTCQLWFHRSCAGVTRRAYVRLSNTSDHFYCHDCLTSLFVHSTTDLQDKLHSLSEELRLLKSVYCSAVSEPQPPPASVAPVRGSYSSVVCNTSSVPATSGASIASPRPNVSQTTTVRSLSSDIDRSRNIVVYGIAESPPGSLKHVRVRSDLDKVASLLSSIDDHIVNTSIHDCFRLGKYQRSHNRSRPLLVKLHRPVDVLSVLSHRSSLPSGNSIKPDQSPDEWKIVAILLKERWSLIQAGVERKNIKSSISVNSKLHGRVIDFQFVKVGAVDSGPSDGSRMESSFLED